MSRGRHLKWLTGELNKSGNPGCFIHSNCVIACRYHLIHSVALLGIGLSRRPRLSGFLMVAGLIGFCGSTYYHAFTGDKQFRRLTPYGGMFLIAAWLSLAI